MADLTGCRLGIFWGVVSGDLNPCLMRKTIGCLSKWLPQVKLAGFYLSKTEKPRFDNYKETNPCNVSAYSHLILPSFSHQYFFM